MSQALPDEKLVYSALQKEFATQKLPLNVKSVKKRVQTQDADPRVQALLRQHSIDSISIVAKALLDEEIYLSPQKAKLRFPETSTIRPTRSADRCTTKVGAASHAVEDAHDISGPGPVSVVPNPDEGGWDTLLCRREKQQQTAPPATGKAFKPTLFPVYLPVRIQVRLLARTQRILERVCYDFTKEHMPGVLELCDWECAESIELNKWSQYFTTCQHEISKQMLAKFTPRSGFWESILQLRHAAVHRDRFTAEEIERLLLDAETLCGLLDALEALECIAHSRHTMLLFVGDMKRNKDLLESEAARKLGDLAQQKKELERQKKLVVSDMLEKDEEYKQRLGENLEETLGLGLDDLEMFAYRRDSMFSAATTFDEELSRYDTRSRSSSRNEDEAATVRQLD